MKKMITCLLNKINLSKMNRYKHEKLTKILTITLLVLILLSVFAISFMHFTYALTSEGGDPSSSLVTDLADTYWYIPSGWTTSRMEEIFSLNCFYSASLNGVMYSDQVNSATYISLGYNDEGGTIKIGSDIYISSYSIYIHIIDGNTTASTLLSWFNSYGIQLDLDDLTDTTWNVASGWQAEAGYGTFNVNVTTGDSYTNSNIRIGFYDDGLVVESYSNVVQIAGNIYYPTDAIILTFTGGTDVTNPKLIAWLSKYGELQGSEPEPDLGTFTIYYEDESRYETFSYVIGQTFGEWVQSSYNILGASVVSGYNKSNGEIDDYISLGVNNDFPEISYGQYYDLVVLPEGGYAHSRISIVDRAIYNIAPIAVYQDVFGAGYEVGYDDGYSRGQSVGEGIGYNNGFDDGYIDGYSKGESDTFVSGFFGNFLSGVVQAIDSIHFYEYTVDDMGTSDTSDDEVFYISPWSIFIVFIGLAFVIIFLKVFRGG